MGKRRNVWVCRTRAAAAAAAAGTTASVLRRERGLRMDMDGWISCLSCLFLLVCESLTSMGYWRYDGADNDAFAALTTFTCCDTVRVRSNRMEALHR